MKVSGAVMWLSSLVLVLAIVAAGAGLLYDDAGSSFPFTTLRGQTVQIYGHGLYRYDTVLIAVGFRVADAVTLIWAVPLLALSIWSYRRGSLRGGLVLAGTLAYFVYTYGSVAFGAAHNNLFLVYLILFSSSIFGTLLVLMSFDTDRLPAHIAAHLPRRGTGLFLIVSGSILLVIWLVLSIIPALLGGSAPPEVASYTTIITFVVDMGLVAPALIVAGALILRRAALGYLLAPVMLAFTVSLGISITVFGIVQYLLGLVTLGQFIGFVIPFTVLTLVAVWYAIQSLRHYSNRMPGEEMEHR